MTEELLLQFLLIFGLSIIFTSISLTRQTVLTLLLTAILWFVCGIANYMLSLSVLTFALSYMSLILGVIFMLAGLKVLGDTIQEKREARWKVKL